MLGGLSSAAKCRVVVVMSVAGLNVAGVKSPVCGVESTIVAISNLRKDGDG